MDKQLEKFNENEDCSWGIIQDQLEQESKEWLQQHNYDEPSEKRLKIEAENSKLKVRIKKCK